MARFIRITLALACLKLGDVFSHTEVDYAGPIYIKGGPVRKPKGRAFEASYGTYHLCDYSYSAEIHCPQRNTIYYVER